MIPRDRWGAAGQGIVDYGIVLIGIALVALLALGVFGDGVSSALDLIGDLVDRATR